VLGFIWPAALPLALRFFLQDSALDAASGAMTVVFAAALSLTAYRFHVFFGRALKLQVELEDRTRELYSANARLQAEMAEHQATEASLRQAQKTEAVGRLTAGMAHDFNNLLTVISGSVELLQAKLGPHDRHATYLTTISEAAERGAVLTRQLLAFARQQKLKPRPTDLNALIREMSPLLNSVVGGKVRIELRLAEDLWAAHVDPGQIEHAIMNLVINARDAMDEGGVVTIDTMNVAVAETDREARLAAGEYASISVADTGSGMSREVLAQAFDPFFTTKAPGKGTGLGLSQVYGIVQQSGGATEIESESGRGTRVRMHLPKPRNAGERSPGERRSPAADDAIVMPAGLRILLIEDDAENGAVTGALREAGHEVIAANNTAGALRLIQTEIPPDLAILDLAMPEGTGELLLRLIRHRFPAMPIVFLTGESDARAADGDRWLLQKPVGAGVLLDLVAEAARERDHLSGSVEHA
jgi:signal transduction histidine kinase